MRLLHLLSLLGGILIALPTSSAGSPLLRCLRGGFIGESTGESPIEPQSQGKDDVPTAQKEAAGSKPTKSILANVSGVSANVFIILKQVVDIPMLVRRCRTGEVNPMLGFWFFAFIGFFQMQRVVYYFLWWNLRGFHYLATVSVFSLAICVVRVGSQLKFQQGRTGRDARMVAFVWTAQLLGFVVSLVYGFRLRGESSESLSALFAANGLLMSAFGYAIIVVCAGDARTMWKMRSTEVISLRYNVLTFFEKVSSAIYATAIQDYFTLGFMVAASVTITVQLTEYFIIWWGNEKDRAGGLKSSRENTIGNPISDMLAKMAKCQSEGKLIVNFAVGSPPFDPPAALLQTYSSLVKGACNSSSGNFMYTDPAGTLKLRELIASEVVSPRQGDVAVSASNVIVTSGAQCALVSVLKSILSPKDGVVITTPAYPFFSKNVEMWGATCHYANADPHTLDVDMGSIARAMRRGGRGLRALMLCSPSNPSGKVMSKQLLEDVTSVVKGHCKKYGTKVWIIMDHTYWNITWGGAEIPPLFEHYDEAIVISSFSKDLGLAGERLGFAAVNPRSGEAGTLAATLAKTTLCLVSYN